MSKATKDQQVENKEKKEVKVRMKVINKKREEKNDREKRMKRKKEIRKRDHPRMFAILNHISHNYVLHFIIFRSCVIPRVIIDISTRLEEMKGKIIKTDIA